MADKYHDKVEQLSGEAALQKIRSLLGNFRAAMFTTTDGREIHTRPMALLGQASDFGGALWFFTDKRSHKIDEIDQGVTALVFQNDADSAHLQLSGRARHEPDPERMRALYTPFIKIWFPDGLDDPNLTMIRFDADSGHFWETPGGAIQTLAAFAKALVTGSPARAGNTGDVSLR